jgi:uncharacterized protein
MISATCPGMNKSLLEYVRPYYAKKDAMHDVSHIRRFLSTARSISKRYHVDRESLTYAAYFHGINEERNRNDLMKFMASQGLSKGKAEKILRVASESHKESKPTTIEGMILHDAHLVEGGKTLMVAKILVTGALRGYPISHTIRYFEGEVDGRFRCYLPQTQERYSEMEKFAREFFHDLKMSLS